MWTGHSGILFSIRCNQSFAWLRPTSQDSTRLCERYQADVGPQSQRWSWQRSHGNGRSHRLWQYCQVHHRYAPSHGLQWGHAHNIHIGGCVSVNKYKINKLYNLLIFRKKLRRVELVLWIFFTGHDFALTKTIVFEYFLSMNYTITLFRSWYRTRTPDSPSKWQTTVWNQMLTIHLQVDEILFCE